jgi:DNA-binding NtrC family response regulator
VLVTDVMLASGMNGVDLADAAAALRPGLAVVYMSGFTASPETQERIRVTGAPFLSKPFTSAQLELAMNRLVRRGGIPGQA